MKQGRSMQEVIAEVQRQAALKRDFTASTTDLALLNGQELHIAGQGEFPMLPLAHTQLAKHLGIHYPFYERLRAERPQLLDRVVNELREDRPSAHMVRTLDGEVRAILGRTYRRLDYLDLMNAVLPVLGEIPDVQFPSLQITPSRLYIKATFPRMQGEVAVGDIVQAGLVISDSEVGNGSLRIKEYILRLSCLNGMVGEDVVRRYHAGKAIDPTETAEVTLRDATLQAIDQAYWMTVQDMVRTAVDEARFHEVLRKMQLAAGTPAMEAPIQGVQELAQKFELSQQQEGSVLTYLLAGGNLSQWGAVNAVTRAAEDQDDYEEATRLETVGGQLLTLPRKDWLAIAQPA